VVDVETLASQPIGRGPPPRNRDRIKDKHSTTVNIATATGGRFRRRVILSHLTTFLRNDNGSGIGTFVEMAMGLESRDPSSVTQRSVLFLVLASPGIL
jgi:hypothetical protein